METPRTLGRYRLVQRVGEGGMGVVHLALDPRGRTVAVKVLRAHVAADPHARQRLAREVSTLQRVRHPRVAEVIDADTEGEQPFVVTRYVPAPPLDDMVRLEGPLTGTDLARLGDGLGEALAAIHAAGVVHRDLKPGNVLMLDGNPVVIDFGIAHVADDVRLTSTGLVMGTPGYLSPEVLDGDPVSEATDWWGWAATMAFAATGRPPFGRGPLEAVLDRVKRASIDLDGVPPALVSVLQSALSPSPGDRPAPGYLRLAVRELWEASSVRVSEPVRQLVDEPVTQVVAPVRQQAVHHGSAQTTTLRTPPTRMMPVSQPVVPVPFVDAPPVQLSPPHQQAYHLPPSGPPHPHAPPAPYSPPAPYFPPAPYAPPVPHAAPAYAPPPRPARTGVLAAGLVAWCAVAAVAPVVAAIAGALWMVLARTVHRSQGTVLRRRYEHGPRRGDVAVAVAASPWHLLMAALASVAALILPALVGVSTAFIAGLVVGDSGPQPGRAIPIAAGALAAAVVAWWGLGGTALRRGSRSVVRALTPGRAGQLIGVGLLLIITVAAVLVVVDAQGQPDWAPLQGPPFSR